MFQLADLKKPSLVKCVLLYPKCVYYLVNWHV